MARVYIRAASENKHTKNVLLVRNTRAILMCAIGVFGNAQRMHGPKFNYEGKGVGVLGIIRLIGLLEFLMVSSSSFVSWRVKVRWCYSLIRGCLLWLKMLV